MPTTSTSRPAMLSTTMRRVRLEKMVKSRKRRMAVISLPGGTSIRRQPRRPERGASPADCAPSWVSGWARCGSSVVTALSSLLLAAIADAVEGLDHLEIVVHGLDLLARPFDVAVDGAVVHIDLVVIGGVHQRVARLDHARAQRQCLQDEEFGDRQGHPLPLPGAGMALLVHHQGSA